MYLVLLAACGSAQHMAPRPTVGSIAGLARDHDSGDPIAHADVYIRAQGDMRAHPITTKSDGTYRVDRLAPGNYNLEATFAGQPIDISNIIVRAGDTAVVDLTFTLGRPDRVQHDFGNPKDGAVDYYRPKNLSPQRSLIEGTVNDVSTRNRVAGAVVFAVEKSGASLEAVSDDSGRYRIDAMPGTYSVSAYYTISGRGQIEVRRMGIHVDPAEAAIVPLWVELQHQ